MYVDWTKHLPEEKKEQFRKEVARSKDVLDRLFDLLNEKEAELDRLELSSDSFDKPNWAYKQAFRNGSRKILRDIKELIYLENQSRSQGE